MRNKFGRGRKIVKIGFGSPPSLWISHRPFRAAAVVIILSLDGYIRRCSISQLIVNFKCGETEKIWQRQFSRKLPGNIQQKALYKLQLLDAAVRLEHLQVPPGNRLEALKGDRKGQHSMRINQQWRICFKWMDGNAHKVEIVDYH